jgi:hypothetical protein
MNCHKQVKTDHPEVQKVAQAIAQEKPIEWVRVHNLPDHVYFNHQPHVRAGLACQECHGQVESMGRVEQVAPLTMGWCLNCHRTGGEPTPPGGNASPGRHPPHRLHDMPPLNPKLVALICSGSSEWTGPAPNIEG